MFFVNITQGNKVHWSTNIFGGLSTTHDFERHIPPTWRCFFRKNLSQSPWGAPCLQTARFFTKRFATVRWKDLNPGPNPTTFELTTATPALQKFKTPWVAQCVLKIKIFYYNLKKRFSPLRRRRCSCKFRSRRIGSRYVMVMLWRCRKRCTRALEGVGANAFYYVQ
jgi:hypothetical protein